jgi:hypothetical protein
MGSKRRIATTPIEGSAMKSKGPHPMEALTGHFVHTVQECGTYADGNGLYLRVDGSGSKRWILRTVVRGKRRDIGLGGFSCTSLVQARTRARILRKIAREGGDPLAARAQVCSTEFPEITQARNDAVELLEKVGVEIEDPALRRPARRLSRP